jgi:hypothetical protein
VIIEVIADPHNWEHWEEARAYLEPARARGGFAEIIEPDEELFAVLEGDELLACATAWFDVGKKLVEVKLVGGRDHRRWIADLDEYITGASVAAGATGMQAWGRRGWTKELRGLGWASFPVGQNTNGYVKKL